MSDVSKLIESQKVFFGTNSTKPIAFRIELLRKLKTVIQENEKAFYTAIYNDFKKSEFDTYTSELSLVYHDINEAVNKLSSWSKPKRVRTNLLNFPAKSRIHPEPLGTCLVIGAWNYPYQLSLSPVVAAIAAGNTVILKPSELPAETSAIMAKVINTHFDKNVLHVVEGGIPITTSLLEEKFDKIFFTGSVPVGRIVYQAAAKNLTPVTLELGGKSPAIITESSKLEITVKRLIWAKFLNAGQTCIAPDYVLIQESIKDRFLKAAIKEIKEAKYAFENNNYVQVINERNFDRLRSLISINNLDAQKIYFGGQLDEKKRYFSPTILTDISLDDEIMKDEIFGPILPVIAYKNLDEAIEIVKKYPKPLSCYVFTGNKKEKEKVLNEISFGGGAVNEAIMHITNPKLPFGGVGNSGIGAYHGEAGFQTFSHLKSVLDKPTWFELNLKFSPITDSKLKWIKKLMG